MKFIFMLLIITFHCFDDSAQRRLLFNKRHFKNSSETMPTRAVRKVLQNVLSPKQVLKQSKQLLFGLPEVAVLGTIHELCSSYLFSGNITSMVTPKIEDMYFQLRTACSSLSFPISSAEKILENTIFDIRKPVVLFISGWTSTIESNNIIQMAKAYNCRGGYNFLALNASDFMDTLYTWSAINTDALGRIVAQGLVQLHNKVPAENIHIIGFSLGAHIAGLAARYFEEITDKKIQRITGLDPANPCFGQRSLASLQRDDAKFVDVIHTNPGVLGKRDTLGDVDFYVQGLEPIKPGCRVFGCSHIRAWEYYAESIYPGHEKDFPAAQCTSLLQLKTKSCRDSEVIMGLSVSADSNGIYQLNVNRALPYGKGATSNSDLILSNCGFCDFAYIQLSLI